MPTNDQQEYWAIANFLFCSPTDSTASAALVRAVAALLTSRSEIDFALDDDRLIFQRPDRSAPEWGDRPVILTDQELPHPLVVDHFWRPAAPYHYLVLSPGFPVEKPDFESAWQRILDLTGDIIRASEPELVTSFANVAMPESDPINFESACQAGATPVLTPWTYLSARRLETAVWRDLVTLPGITATPLGNGIALTATPLPGTPPASPLPDFYVDPLLR
ncbi:hypothetical protein ACQP2E_12310 [Actinoplanes sp. CA-015351]|uniref:hypothetical protein n=1 Tax=Actinoplanes sp. CA-015351 TaxID=3239897 RepID=UPI003D99293B